MDQAPAVQTDRTTAGMQQRLRTEAAGGRQKNRTELIQGTSQHARDRAPHRGFGSGRAAGPFAGLDARLIVEDTPPRLPHPVIVPPDAAGCLQYMRFSRRRQSAFTEISLGTIRVRCVPPSRAHAYFSFRLAFTIEALCSLWSSSRMMSLRPSMAYCSSAPTVTLAGLDQGKFSFSRAI